MRFHKSSKKPTKNFPFPGVRETLDGFAALQKSAEFANVKLTQNPASVASSTGFTLTGNRQSTIIRDGQTAVFKSLQNAAKFHAPDVYFILLGDLPGDTQFPAHGFFQLYAKNVQEAVDFSLIARRIAELALTPGLCVIDAQFTARALQTINMPEAKLVRKFLGDADDEIDTPTAAQKILFGEKRRRVPHWLDIDRPLGVGAQFGVEKLKHIAAQNAFFEQHIEDFANQAFREFGELTGRFYPPAQGYLTDDAQYLIIAQGSIVDDLSSLADYLRQIEKRKIGVVNIHMSNPFPGEMISRLLKGKKGVTVLENAEDGFSDDPPLFRAIQISLSKAAENGQARKDTLPYPDFAVYQKSTDRPKLFSGIFSLSEKKPKFGDLRAVMDNMQANGVGKKRYFLGVNFAESRSRFPLLQTLQQQIHQAYPNLPASGLGGANGQATPAKYSKKLEQDAKSRKITIFDIDAKNCRDAGQLLTKAYLNTEPELRANGFSEIDSAQNSNAFIIHLWENNTTAVQSIAPIDSLIATRASLLQNVVFLQQAGLLILDSAASPETVWEGFSEQLRAQIRQKQLRIFIIDAQKIAREHTAIPGFFRQLSLHALLGGFIRHDEKLPKNERQLLLNQYRRLLAENFSESQQLQNEFFNALQAGMSQAQEMRWQEFPPFQAVPATELEAPFAVQQVRKTDESVYDLARFWDTTGYFYATQQPEIALIDPQLATAAMAANSATFRDLTQFRSEIPQLIPEMCSGCGLCAMQCPEIALPATIADFPTLVNSAITQCQNRGQNMIQMQRIAGQFAKVATRIFTNDDLRQHRTLGSLFAATFEQLLEKMSLSDEKRLTLQKEFETLREAVIHFPIVKTDTFFETPNQAAKGSGKVFILTVNPASCTGCNECVMVCPENALESMAQMDDLVENYRRNWQFLMELPEPSQSELGNFTSEQQPETLAYQLFNKKVYHSMSGGDPNFPGSGAKTAVHLLLASLEVLYQPRIAAFVEKLDGLIKKLEAKIQGRLEAAVHINDFDEFSKRLAALNPDELSLADLAKTVEAERPKQKLDGKPLERLSRLLKKIRAIRDAYVDGANGNGRSPATLLLSGKHLSVWGAKYPYNPFPYPSVNVEDGDIAGLAAGIFDGVLAKTAETFAAVRAAENALEGVAPPESSSQKRWEDFSEAERALCPPVLIISGEKSGTEKLSGLLSGALPFKIAILNNTAGFQESREFTPTEFGLWSLTQQTCFVAQSSPGKPGHFLKSLREGMAFAGPTLFHIYTSEPRQHGLRDWQAAQQEKLAIDSRAFPVFTFDPRVPGSFAERLTLDGNPDFENDWMRHIDEKQTFNNPEMSGDAQLTIAHWAVNEARFSREFSPLGKGEWQEKHTPLAEYLRLIPEERVGREAVITLVNHNEQPIRIVVSKQFVAAVEKKLATWRFLQDLAGTRAAVNRQIVEKIQSEARADCEQQKQSVQADFEEKLAALDQQHWQIYHQRLTQKFLTLCGIGSDEPLFKKPLREYREVKSET